jgi:hypothetical protein
MELESSSPYPPLLQINEIIYENDEQDATV